MKPSGWREPRTEWSEADGVTRDDLRRIESNSYATEEGPRMIDGIERTVRTALTGIASALSGITSKHWAEAPDCSLDDVHGHIPSTDAHVPSGYYLCKTRDDSQYIHWDDITDKPEQYED